MSIVGKTTNVIFLIFTLLLSSCVAQPKPNPAKHVAPPPGAVAQHPPSPLGRLLKFVTTPKETAVSKNEPTIQHPVELNELAIIAQLHEASAEHTSQMTLLSLIKSGQPQSAFDTAFDAGDELFETQFNGLDGVGANVGNGLRFSQLPRADLDGTGQWANHFPKRITGPNAEACNDCHGTPVDDGAGGAANNNVRDPLHSGQIDQFIVRNTPHLFAAGALQVLAEEMTEELHIQRQQAMEQACATQQTVTLALEAKGVAFGNITITAQSKAQTAKECSVTVDESAIVGVDADLVVRPFQWKGVVATVRGFNRDAAHQELGLQAVEIVGDNIDGDGDGVVNELSIGDQTVLAVYVAAQPRPTTRLELSRLGLIEPISKAEEAAIHRGEQRFEQIGCGACHMAQMHIADPIFHEPSQNPFYRDDLFPAGQDPVSRGLDPAFAIAFDLTSDQHDNVLQQGEQVIHLGALQSDGKGGAVVALYGDMKRHEMGDALAESIADEGIPASVFLTENLWGVGSTAPYLHDGRATTLSEAILAHGGEAEHSRNAFVALTASTQGDLITFLNNLVIYKTTPPPLPTTPILEAQQTGESLN